VSLSDYKGKKLILYFYPHDDTPGCTKQACSLRDHNSAIKALGAEILGVSTQNQASHQRFAAKHNLTFPLLADTDKSIGKAYGAIGGGGLTGLAINALGMARRMTFIIDEAGKIADIIENPDCANHAEEVLKRLQG